MYISTHTCCQCWKEWRALAVIFIYLYIYVQPLLAALSSPQCSAACKCHIVCHVTVSQANQSWPPGWQRSASFNVFCFVFKPLV